MPGALLNLMASGGGGTITVGTSNTGGESPVYTYGYAPSLSGSSITPNKLAGAPIDAFSWLSRFGGPTGTLTLVLVGNSGGATHGAIVKGVQLGLSEPGVFNSTTDSTTFTWSGLINNPFGAVSGATIPCVLR